ncbi:MAG: hypothetical protein AAFO72_14090 [Pseudomonadota bacterium]
MRVFAFCLLLTSPAHAWDFTPGLPCKLNYVSAQAEVELTYDPLVPVYAITVTRKDPWPQADTFAIRFDGPQGRIIATDRHQLSDDGLSLTVTDRGFGNVLDGLQYNRSATATSGDVEVTVGLERAADAVEAFKACDDAAVS